MASDGATHVAQTPWTLYSGPRRTFLLLVLFLVSTSNYVDRNLITVVLEPIKTEFGVSDMLLGLLTGFAFAAFYTTLGLPLARWADRGDRRVVITLTLAIWSVMTAACGIAQTFWQLALARIGVGAGEAGAGPPAQSLVADYFAPERRARAFAMLTLSGTVGYLIGLVCGSQVAEAYGWRAAFLLLGLPGVALAAATRFLLAEPRTTLGFPGRAAQGEALGAAVRTLFGKRSYVDVTISFVLYSLVAYGALTFTISFMIRVHGMTIAQAGSTFGSLSALAALVGTLGGGFLADRLAARDIAWVARLPGYGMLVSFPLYVYAWLTPSIALMNVAFIVAGTLLSAVIPPIFSALHIVCGSKRRATAAAIAGFAANLVGLGLGPLITGALSDLIAQSLGPAEGLRYALLIATTGFLPCGWFMLHAARHLETDAEA